MEHKQLFNAWQRLINMLSLDKRDIFQIAYYAIFAGLVGLSLPLGIQAIINLLQAAQISTSWIVLVILVTLGVVFQGVLQLMQLRLIENIQQKIFTRSAFEFAYRIPKIKLKELRNFYPPELANRFFDTLTVQKSLSKMLIDVPAAFLQILFGLILLSFYHPFFILYGLILVVFIYVIFRFTLQKGLDTSLTESKYKYKLAHWLQEVARSIVSFKLSGRTSLAMNKTDDLTADYLEARESHFRILILQFAQLIGFKTLLTAGLLAIGGFLVLNQQMNIGQFVASEIIILLVLSSVEKLIIGLEMFYDLLTSLEKLGQVVDKELERQDSTIILDTKNGIHIELNEVTVIHPTRKSPILNNIDLNIEPGSRILIKGPNGSGKSTLLRIIAGLSEPDSGAVYLNGNALKGMNLNEYRSYLGHSIIEESPFEGTIYENITFGDTHIPMEDVQWAVTQIGLTSFIREQPEGYQCMLYPEGQQIPNTVAKKIVLARSVVRKPPVLILNESLDQFDPEEAERIINFLTAPEHTWTLIVVSHNPVWEKRLNKIIYLEKGTIV